MALQAFDLSAGRRLYRQDALRSLQNVEGGSWRSLGIGVIASDQLAL